MRGVMKKSIPCFFAVRGVFTQSRRQCPLHSRARTSRPRGPGPRRRPRSWASIRSSCRRPSTTRSRASRIARWTSPIRNASSARCSARFRHSRQDQRRRDLQGLRRRRVRRHARGSIRPTRWRRACWRTVAGHRRARRVDHQPRRAGRRRRSRTAATTRRATRRSPGSTTCSRPASGKATCGASRTTSSARKRSATAR